MKYVVSAYVVRWNLVLGVIFVAIISFMDGIWSPTLIVIGPSLPWWLPGRDS